MLANLLLARNVPKVPRNAQELRKLFKDYALTSQLEKFLIANFTWLYPRKVYPQFVTKDQNIGPHLEINEHM